jgi:hypothetical protein
MKLSKIRGMNSKRIVAVLVTLFVVAGAIVGYMNQLQTPTAGPAPPGIGYEIPGSAQSAVTFFATTSPAKGVLPGTYTSSYGGRMVELQAQLTVQVEDSKSTSSKIITLASSLGGYVAESSFDEGSSSSNLVLRVPQENFTLALKQLDAFGKVKSQSISSNDVTEQYVSLQAQLGAYKAEELTLLRILNASNTVTDALATENAIRDVQAQIDQIEGTLLVMDRLVDFATLNVQLIQPAASPTFDFNTSVQSAILSFYTIVTGMMILGASVLPIAVVGGVAYYPYHRYSKKKQKPAEAKVNAGN